MFIFRFPEIYFALFLTAGVYKADPRLFFIQRLFDLTLLFLIITVICTLIEVFKGSLKFTIPPKKIFLPYLIIVTISIISFTYTKDPMYGLYKLLRFSILTSAAFVLPFFIFQEEKRVKRFFGLFVLLALFMVLDILLGGLKPFTIGFKSAFSSNYLAVGRICGSAILMILFYFMISFRNYLLKSLFFLIILFLLLGILLSGGRGPIIALIISIVSIFIYFFVRSEKRFKYFSISKTKIKQKIMVSIILIIILGIYLFILYKPYFLTTYNRFLILFEKGGRSTISRIEMFKKSIDTIKDPRYIITGLGIGGFSTYYKKHDYLKRIYPHNIFLEIWSELGLFGFLAFFLLLFRTFSFANNNIVLKQKISIVSLNISLLSLLIFMLINSSLSGDLNDNRLLFAWIGTIFSVGKISNDKN